MSAFRVNLRWLIVASLLSAGFVVSFARGATTTSTPQLIKLTLVWRSVVALLWGIAADIDVTEASPDGRSTKQQIADLKSALGSGTLIEVTYRNDTTESQKIKAEKIYVQAHKLQLQGWDAYYSMEEWPA